MSLAIGSSENGDVIIVKPDTVTPSDMRKYDVLLILTLTLIQGHTDRNHENNKCLIISETIEAIPIKFAGKIVRPKVDRVIASPMTFTFKSRPQVRLKPDYFLTCNILDNIEAIIFTLGMPVDV